MRLCLISLYDLENNALRLLATFLRARGHKVLELYLRDWRNNSFTWPTEGELRAVEREIRRFGARAVGVSLRASAYLRVCSALCQRLRLRLGLPLILGGVHPSVRPAETLEFCDYVVLGEGEHALAELVEKLEAGQPTHRVPNVWTRHRGELVQNPPRPLVQELAEVSARDFLHPHKVVLDGGRISRRDPLLGDTLYLTTASRGCPYACSFCFNTSMRSLYHGRGPYTRLRSVDDVMAELHEARGVFPRLKRIRFDDEVFPQEEAWVARFLARFQREIELPFDCFLDPRAVRRSRLQRMARAGLGIVYMGIQANDRVCRTLYDRRASNEAVLRAARLIHGLGLIPRYHVMVDDPATTEADRRALFELLLRLPRPYQLYLFSLTVLPGTELERELLERGTITPQQVEGAAQKSFRQWRATLDYPRPDDERFWLALLVLVSKPWLSPELLRRLSESASWRKRPGLLGALAGLANTAHMVGEVPKAFARGEVGPRLFRRFLTPGSWITA